MSSKLCISYIIYFIHCLVFSLCFMSINTITTQIVIINSSIPGHHTSDTPPPPQHPAFLPTVPPEIHFPQEEDYDQNNIHRPTNPIEPALAGLPPGLTLPPPYGDTNKKLSVISLQADSPTSVKMLFGLPPVLVGLRGSVDLRYTDKA